VSLEVIRLKNKSDDERRHFNMHFRVSTGRQEEEEKAAACEGLSVSLKDYK
jgi:hypothetical protein